LAKVAGDKYSYADLDDFSDLIGRTVQGAPETSKVERRGYCRRLCTWNTHRSGSLHTVSNLRLWEVC